MHHAAMPARPALGLAMLLGAAVLLAGCGEPRVRVVGEAGGVPVQLTVEISRTFVRDLKNRGPGGGETQVYVEHGFYGPWEPPYWYHGRYWTTPPDPYWDPFWGGGMVMTGPAPTTAWLLAGDGPGEARLFRAELDWGRNEFTMLARPGHAITFTVQSYGGREGWEVVGTYAATDKPGQRVRLDLLEHAPRMEVSVQPPAVPAAPPVGPGGAQPQQ
jgi:hypothetical protein